MSDRPYLFQELTGRNVDELRLQLNRELRKLANAYDETRLGKYPIHYSEPDRPRDGMVRYADGTTWDPGGGEGLYAYYNSRWNGLSSTDWLIEVNKGNISGHSLKHISGHDESVSAVAVDLWGDNTTLVWLQSATTMEAVSTSINDTGAGSGARSITIEGLDATWAEVSETLSLDGTSATSTTQTFIRINDVYVSSVGTYTSSNDGDITIQVTGAGANQAHIYTGEGRSSNSHYTVPAGKTGYIQRISVTMDSAQSIEAHLVKRENADDTVVAYSPNIHLHHWEGISTPVSEQPIANHILPAKTDVWMRVSKSAAGIANVQADYDILLVDNPV